MRLSLRDRTAETAYGVLPSLPHILTHCPSTCTRYSGLHSVSTVNFLTPLTVARYTGSWKVVSAYCKGKRKMGTGLRLQQQATLGHAPCAALFTLPCWTE